VHTIRKKFVLKKATSQACSLKLSWQPGRVSLTPFRPTLNWRELGEKLASDLASFTRSAKSISSQVIVHFSIFNATISEFGACLAQNNMAQEQNNMVQSGS